MPTKIKGPPPPKPDPEKGIFPSSRKGSITRAQTCRSATARCARGTGAKSKRRQEFLAAGTRDTPYPAMTGANPELIQNPHQPPPTGGEDQA